MCFWAQLYYLKPAVASVRTENYSGLFFLSGENGIYMEKNQGNQNSKLFSIRNKHTKRRLIRNV